MFKKQLIIFPVFCSNLKQNLKYINKKMSTSHGSLMISQSNSQIFSSSKQGDMMLWTETASQQILVGTSNVIPWMSLSNGNVGIGIAPSTYKLYVGGDVYSTGNVTAYSDRTIKKDLEVITNALDKVCQISGYTYTRTDMENAKRNTGLIAQEVQTILPEAVSEDPNHKMGVMYGNMAGIFVEAFKELKKMVDDLKNRVDSLETK